MHRPLSVITLVAPELAGIVERRHTVLRAVAAAEPIGRRLLAERLGWSERITRGEVELLRDIGLIELGSAGIFLSEGGRQILAQLGDGLQDLQRELSAKFGLSRAVVVPGDGDANGASRDALARAGGEAILEVLSGADVVAVSGGSTLAAVTMRLPPHADYSDVTVVPTGGGLGDTLEIEANTVAAQLAHTLRASYRLLHLRDDLGEQSVNVLLEGNSAMREIFDLIRSASVVVQGVGTLRTVAERRGFSADRIQTLIDCGAVGESLGYFFDISGRVVEAVSGVGIRLDDLRQVAHVIVIAGGASKADAVRSLLGTGLQHVLVTDEAIARAILSDDDEHRGTD